jgi:flagellin
VFNAATAANVNILRTTNELFQVSQKRVATGKRIFSAADDATRYTMSQTMLSRSRNIDQVNNNISTALKTLESTDKTLTQMRALVGQMVKLATDAQNAGSTPSIAATNSAQIGATTTIAGVASNHRLSITSDNGKNFTFTFGTNATAQTWGDIASALAAANIGVELNFTTAGTQNRMEIRSVDGKTGFRIDGSSSQEVVDDLTGLDSGYDGSYAASKFVAGSAAQPTYNSTTPYGLRFGTGGAVRTIGTSGVPNAIASGSSISFIGSDGVARTWGSPVASTVAQMVGEINAMNAGVKAEIVTGGQISLRRMDGGVMTVLNGTGTFNSAAATSATINRFNLTIGNPIATGNPILGSANNDRRLELGQQYDAIKVELTNLISNNVVQAGRNLLQGQGTRIILNEFAANPIQIDGVNVSVTGNLALNAVGSGFAVDTTIQTAVAESQAALVTIDGIASGFATYASFARERYDLNRAFSSELKALGDDLVAADVAEESAKLTALQTQQQFAVQAFSAGSANAQSLLRLLG